MQCSVHGCRRAGAMEAVVRLSHRPTAARPGGPLELHEIVAHLCQGHATGEPFDLRRLRLGEPYLSYRGKAR